jgi:hypothetical protein
MDELCLGKFKSKERYFKFELVGMLLARLILISETICCKRIKMNKITACTAITIVKIAKVNV